MAIARQWHTEHVSAATVKVYDSQSRETVRYGDVKQRMTAGEGKQQFT